MFPNVILLGRAIAYINSLDIHERKPITACDFASPESSTGIGIKRRKLIFCRIGRTIAGATSVKRALLTVTDLLASFSFLMLS